MATDVITATENWGKAETAFQIALKNARVQREQALLDLGADVTRPTGKVMSVENAGKLYGPAGDPAVRERVSLRTGFGEGTLASISKEAAGEAYQATQALTERGVGEGGLTGTARTLTTEAQKIGEEEAVKAAMGAISEANLGIAAAKEEALQAKAALDTVKGVRTKVADKRKNKQKNNQTAGRPPGSSGRTSRKGR